jgi:hypothetical protein
VEQHALSGVVVPDTDVSRIEPLEYRQRDAAQQA